MYRKIKSILLLLALIGIILIPITGGASLTLSTALAFPGAIVFGLEEAIKKATKR